jgi:hypothetical protein
MLNERQAPNNKHQIPNKSQGPKSKISNSWVIAGSYFLAIGILGIICDLEFGIWDF